MDNSTYITVLGWMADKEGLDLSGNELLCYALIYGYCQFAETNAFEGSKEYIADRLNISTRTAASVVSDLVIRGLLDESIITNVKGITRRSYKIVNPFYNEKIADINKVNSNSIYNIKEKKNKRNENADETIINEPTIRQKRELAYDRRKREYLEEIHSEEWRELVGTWLDYKKNEHNFQYKTKETFKAFCLDLHSKSNGNIEIARDIINTSMANLYLGIFKPKDMNNNNNTNNSKETKGETETWELPT